MGSCLWLWLAGRQWWQWRWLLLLVWTLWRLFNIILISYLYYFKWVVKNIDALMLGELLKWIKLSFKLLKFIIFVNALNDPLLPSQADNRSRYPLNCQPQGQLNHISNWCNRLRTPNKTPFVKKKIIYIIYLSIYFNYKKNIF